MTPLAELINTVLWTVEWRVTMEYGEELAGSNKKPRSYMRYSDEARRWMSVNKTGWHGEDINFYISTYR